MKEKQEEEKSRKKIVNKNSTMFIYNLKEDSLVSGVRTESERKAGTVNNVECTGVM